MIARAGGTLVHDPATDSGPIVAALAEIRAALPTCAYALSAEARSRIDEVNLGATPAGGARRPLTRVADAAACGDDRDDLAGDEVALCPEVCTLAPTLEVELGCPARVE